MPEPAKKYDLSYFIPEGDDENLMDRMKELEALGHKIQMTPTSGAPAFWVDLYEVVGPTAILNLTQQILDEGIKS